MKTQFEIIANVETDKDITAEDTLAVLMEANLVILLHSLGYTADKTKVRVTYATKEG